MTSNTSVSDLIIERLFEVPPEAVWRAWTEPEQAMRWWGPKAFTSPACKIDFRVGGRYHLCMAGPMPDGSTAELWSTGIYQEIVPFAKIVCTDSFADAEGNIVPASFYGMEGYFPMEMTVTVIFDEVDGKTRMTLVHAGMPDWMGNDASHGWNESFDKLAAVLSQQM